MLVLTRADLERVLAPLAVVDAMATAFRRHGDGRSTVPPRLSTPVGRDGVLLSMPAAFSDGCERGLGVKQVSVYPDNRARGHPTLYATYVLMDGASGEPLALLEGTYLTGLRTGATSALAARLLARADARRVACFGAGVQARFQLLCLAAVRSLERVVVLGRDPRRARAFAESMSATLGVPVESGDDPRRAAREAQLIVCATTSPTPVVFGADLGPGTHVDAVGAFRATERELDGEAIRRARVVVDTYAGALEEAGDVLIPLGEGIIERTHVAAELAEIVTGRRPGRTSAEEITVFKSVGFALEDLAAAQLAYDRARAQGIGKEVTL
ncbi:MAG TPA: ornithine cyclodeaminase family protein [Candidatus Acidoferrum sp.]|nr:ornithine cyclodeaminase family protein [Candidatus Acidoferrum sp.]